MDQQVRSVLQGPDVDSSGQKVDVRRYAEVSAAVACGLCLLALVGWLLQIRWLTCFGFSWATMKVNTALGLGSVAAGLWFVHRKRRAETRWARYLSLVAVCIGAVSLLQYGGLTLLPFDQWLVVDHWSERLPGRPSPVTALCILLLGVAVGVHRTRTWRLAFHACCWLVIAVGWLALVGFSYAPHSVSQLPWFETLSLPTAGSLLLLGLAALQLRPDEGLLRLLRGTGAHAMIARVYLPLGIVGPVLLGWVLLRSRFSWLRPGTELALFCTLTMLFLVGKAFFAARRLEVLEAHQVEVAHQLRLTLQSTQAALERANAYMAAAPGAMLVVAEDGAIELANRQAEQLFGYAQDELVGRSVHDLLPERFRGRHPDLFESAVIEGVSRDLANGRGLVARRKDGTESSVRIAINPFVAEGRRFVACGLEDVSRRLDAEESRDRARARLELATTAARLGIWEWVVNDDNLIWNDQMFEIYGHTRDTFDGKVSAWQEALVPEEREQVEQTLQLVLEGAHPPSFDFKIRKPSGEVRIIEMSCWVERDAGGQPVRVTGTNKDVTEARLVAERIQLERRRFEGIFNSMFQMTWILSPDGRVLEANRTALELNGCSMEEVKDKPFGETPWCPADASAKELTRAIERAAKGHFNRFWTRLGPNLHKTIPVDLSIKPVLAASGEVEMLVTEARDISESEAARTALIESETKFKNALDHSAIGLTLVDLSGRFTRVNPALCRILGRTPDELLSLSFQDITHPEDLAADMALLHETLEGKRSHYHLEKRYLKKNGQQVWCLLTVSLARSATGEPLYFVSQIQDFTERKRAQERVWKSLREKEVLLREIHHRVKNNLQVVSSILRLARKSVEHPQLRSVFDETSARVLTMALVHEQLCRTEDLGSVDFAAQLRELCGLAQRSSRVESDRVRVILKAESLVLEMDQAIPLGLIANELLTNAFKHAFSGGRSGSVQVSLTRHGSELELSIKDDGKGLPKDFDLSTTSSLGMRIVTRLGKQLRGHISTRRDGGSEFVVRAPVVRDSSEIRLGAA